MAMTQRKERVAVTASRRLRSARQRSVLLVAVWALSGLWDVGHAVAHERDHDEHHAAEVLGDADVSMAVSHDDHGHSHPDSSPAVSTAKRTDFGSLAILAVTPSFQCQVLQVRWCAPAAPARASPRHTSASGPRAPPIS